MSAPCLSPCRLRPILDGFVIVVVVVVVVVVAVVKYLLFSPTMPKAPIQMYDDCIRRNSLNQYGGYRHTCVHIIISLFAVCSSFLHKFLLVRLADTCC